ncbi:MAG TPA: hypothetical protein PKD00_03950 [Burkholderiales bacterium]|nr:hypothetical protein [Burkholderiales bacterium]
MAKFAGQEKKSSSPRVLFTGVANLLPIAFNPSKEQLALVTRGAKSFDNEIKYAFVDATGDTSYKFDVWCKLNYALGENGEPVQVQTDDALTEYICYSWWGRNKPDIFYNEDGSVKGAWYVNPVSCEMEWVAKNDLEAHKNGSRKPRLDYTNPKTHVGIQGEKELYTFIDKLLRITDIDFETPFKNVCNGSYKEVNDIITYNLKRTDRQPRVIKAFLGVKETEDNNYQSVYSNIFAEDGFSFNRLADMLDKREWKDDKSNGNYSLSFYKADAPQNDSVARRAPQQQIASTPTRPTNSW